MRMRKPTKWRMPSRKPFNPEGITLGATVLVIDDGDLASRRRGEVLLTGQVWAQAPTRPGMKYWWVVEESGQPHLCPESMLVAIGQCVDIPLAKSNAA